MAEKFEEGTAARKTQEAGLKDQRYREDCGDKRKAKSAIQEEPLLAAAVDGGAADTEVGRSRVRPLRGRKGNSRQLNLARFLE
jgi:hypothetical protein